MGVYTVVEYFKVNNDFLVPVEFRFLKCKILVGDEEKETIYWINSELWKELVRAVILILKTYGPGTEITFSEPILSTTENLKIAYIFKSNEFKGCSVMEPHNLKPGLLKFVYNSKSMFVVSVSLNKTEIKIQDLRTALPLSQVGSQLKISNYFMQTKSLSDDDIE